MNGLVYGAAYTVGGLALSVLISAAAAQTTDTSASGSAIEEVIVTAQKRAESLQDVPVSVSVLSATQLATLRLSEPADIATQVPNLLVNSVVGGSAPIFSLRGVSMADFSANQSSPVASYVDEVYKATSALFGVQQFDLERVEVLRGPQGTLYGKNTTGGAINFITHEPSFDTEGFLRAGLGNFNRYETEGAAQTPLVKDRVAARLAFTYSKADGWFKNKLPGALDAEGVDQYGVRLSILAVPSDALRLTLRLATSKQNPANYGIYDKIGPRGVGNGLYGLFHSIDPASNPATDYFRTGLGKWQLQSEYSQRRLIRTDSAALTIQWDATKSLAVTSITSWDRGRFFNPEDTDGSPLQTIEIPYDTAGHEVAQDLRLTSSFDGPFNFILGAYAGEDKLRNSTELRYYNDIDFNLDGRHDYQDCLATLDTLSNADPSDNLFPFGCRVGNDFRQERRTWALYSDASYELTRAWKLRFGVRYTHDSADVSSYKSQLRGSDGVVLANLIPGDPLNLDATTGRSLSNSKLTGKVGIDYTTQGGALLYGNYSRGYRSGAFNAQAFFSLEELTAVEPETLDAFEIGAKTEWLDRRLQLNGAAFYSQYKNQQFLDVNPVTGLQVLVNLDKSTIWGAELELTARPVSSVSLRAGLGWLHARVDKAVLRSEDLSGHELPSSPGLTGTLSVDWTALDFGDYALKAHLDGSYVGSQYYEIFDIKRLQQGGYGLFNGRLALASNHQTWEVALWGRNLTNKFYFTSAIDLRDTFGFDYFHIGAPRTYGIEASWHF